MQNNLHKGLITCCHALMATLFIYSIPAMADIDITHVVSSNPFGGGPVLRNGYVAFHSTEGVATSQRGLFTWSNGALTKVAESGLTPIPGGGGSTFTISDFTYTADNDLNGAVVITAPLSGIYENVSGTLQVVADTTTTVPGGSALFDLFPGGNNGEQSASIHNGKVAFSAVESLPLPTKKRGIYTNLNGPLQVVASTTTTIPNTTIAFTNFESDVELVGDTITFVGRTSNTAGLYQWTTNTGLSIVANSNTSCPVGAGAFGLVTAFDVDDNGAVAFYHQGTNCGEAGVGSIYTNARGLLELVLEPGATPTPGGVGVLTSNYPQGFSIDDGRIAFCAKDSITQDVSIFLWDDGVLTRLFGVGDTINGDTLTRLGVSSPSTCDSRTITRNSFEGSKLVFSGQFNNSIGPSGIFIADFGTAPSPVPDGDMNGDSQVNAADVLIAIKIALNLIEPTTWHLDHGDVAPLDMGVPNPNGSINAADIVLIQGKALGIINF